MKKIGAVKKDTEKKQTAPTRKVYTRVAKPEKGPNLTDNLIDNSWDAWIVTDLQMKILNWNTAAEKMYGWKKKETLNRSLNKFIKTQYPAGTTYETALQQVLKDGHWQGEVIQNRKDGSLFTVLASVSLVKDKSKKNTGFIAINHDITGSKQAKEDLLSFRRIMDETNDAIFLIDTETGKFFDFNQTACKMLGYSNEELTQLGPLNIARHITSLEVWRERVKIIREQKGVIFETVYQRKDHTTFPVEISSKVMNISGKDFIVAIARDITKRKQDEEALQKSEAMYRLLAENSSDAVSLIDAEGKVLYISPAHDKMLGYTEEDTLNIGLPEILQRIHPEDRERILQQIIQMREQKSTRGQYAYRALTKQGNYIWLEDVLRHEYDENGQLLRTIVNARDITKRKQVEEKLRKNEEQFRSLAENIPSFIYVLDLTNYQVVYSNQETFLGYDYLELTKPGSVLSELHPEDAPQVMAQWRQVIKGGESELIEYRLRSKAGNWEWVQSNSAAISHTAEGTVKEMVIILTIITKRKQAEEVLRQQTSQLESLRQISLELTAELDLEKLLKSITTHACNLLGSAGGGIYLYRPSHEKLELVIVIGQHNASLGAMLERGDGLSGKVWELNQPIVVDDYESWIGRASIFEGTRFNAVVGVPIRRGDEFLGVLTLLADLPQKFSQQDVALLESFAGHAAVVIHNARLYQNVQNRLNQLEALYETSKSLSDEYDLNPLLQSIVENAKVLLKSSSSGMYLAGTSGGALQLIMITEPNYPTGVYLRPGEGVAGRVAQTRQPIRIDDYSNWEGRSGVYDDFNIHAVLEVPMLYRGELIGVLTADETGESKRKFTEEDERLLSLFASQAAGAIHSARLYNETRRRAQEFAGLYETTRDLSIELDLSTVLTKITERATELLDVPNASIYFYDADQNNLELVATIGQKDIPSGTRIELGNGLIGRVAQTRAPLIVDDYQSWEGRSTLFDGVPYSSIIGVPLLYGGNLMGVLDVAEIEPSTRTFGEADLRLLSLFAGQAASAIDNAKLFEDLKKSNFDIITAYDTTIEGWSRAMDLRDHETEGHTLRVTDLTLKLAKAMQLSESQLMHIRRGSLLHDIGKMGVPDAILLKEGDLSAEEWVVMRKHPQLAYEMLSAIDYLHDALDIPSNHHEKWDGTGYPRGLKGEEIPLAARIFALVDVWDALRSDRPYREGWSAEKAAEYIKTQAGTHFDPIIAEIFLELIAQENGPTDT